MTVLFVFLCLAFTDQPQPTQSRHGLVVAPDGKPVPGAEVWVATGNHKQPLATTKTGADGSFKVSYPEVERTAGVPQIMVRDAQGRIGWSEPLYMPGDAKIPLRIEMRPTVNATGRITAADGKPLAGIKISVRQLYAAGAQAGQGPSSRNYLSLPEFLSTQFMATTDDQGRFVLSGILTGGDVLAGFDAPTHGRFVVYWSGAEPWTLSLPPIARLEGSFIGPVDPKLLAGSKITFSSRFRDPALPKRTIMQDTYATIQPDGSFAFEKLLTFPGTVQLSETENVPAVGEKVTVRWETGPTTKVEVKLQPAAQIKGRIVDQANGAGIGNIRLAIAHLVKHDSFESLVYVRYLTTQADGSFMAYAKPGKLKMVLEKIPEDYIPGVLSLNEPDFWPPATLAAGQSMELPPLKLTRAATLQAQAVDGQDKPVAGAEVHIIVPDGPGRRSMRLGPTTHTDAEGRFTLKGLDPTDTIPIRIRSADGTTAGAVVVTPGEIKEPLKLVVTPEQAVRFKGQVVDQYGKPIVGARVDVQWNCNYVSKKTRLSGMGRRFESHVTDNEERFLTGPLWSCDSYTLEVTAESCTPGSAARLSMTEGKPVEVPPIVLHRAGGTVTGRVVDTQGKPVAAEVFTRADGPKTCTTQTDKDGSFRLTGLFDGPVWIFVRTEDKAFFPTVAPATTGGPPITITLRRQGEPLPPRDKAAEEKLEAQRQQVAKELIHKAVREAGNKPLPTRLNIAWARLEPEKVLAHLGEAKGPAADQVRMAVVEQILTKDFEEALALVNQCDPERSFHLLLKCAENLARTDPDKAKRLAGELLAWARRLNMPNRAWSLAQISALVGRLGNAEAQRKLVLEAADMVENIGGEHMQGYARGLVATELALVDLDRAERLIVGIVGPHERDRHRINIAINIVDKDYAKAQAIYDSVVKQNPNSNYSYTKVRMAYRFGQVGDYAHAVSMAKSITDISYRVNAFGWLALVTKDRVTAHQLIDQVYEDLTKLSSSDGISWSNYGGRGIFAARLAWFAHQVDYPHQDRLLYLVMDHRPTPEDLRYTGERAEFRVRSHVAMAAIMAQVDPAAARHLLLSVEPQRKLIGTSNSHVGLSSWLLAWALVDPQRAVQLADELKTQETEQSLRSMPDPLATLVDLFSQPPSERARFLMGRLGPFWHPGEE